MNEGVEVIVALFILFFIIYGVYHWIKVDSKHAEISD